MRFLSGEQPPTDIFRLREWLTRLVVNINAALDQSTVMEVVSVSSDTNALAGQVLICKNTTPISVTLPINPPIGTMIHIKRRDAQVTVIGTIDGFTNKIINVLNFSMLVYFDGIDWSQI